MHQLIGMHLRTYSLSHTPLSVQGGSFQRPARITDREDEYRKRRLNRIISPDRNDAFLMGDKTPDARVRTYADVMREQQLARERDNTLKNIAGKSIRGQGWNGWWVQE